MNLSLLKCGYIFCTRCEKDRLAFSYWRWYRRPECINIDENPASLLYFYQSLLNQFPNILAEIYSGSELGISIVAGSYYVYLGEYAIQALDNFEFSKGKWESGENVFDCLFSLEERTNIVNQEKNKITREENYRQLINMLNDFSTEDLQILIGCAAELKQNRIDSSNKVRKRKV